MCIQDAKLRVKVRREDLAFYLSRTFVNDITGMKVNRKMVNSRLIDVVSLGPFLISISQLCIYSAREGIGAELLTNFDIAIVPPFHDYKNYRGLRFSPSLWQ